MLSDFYKLYSLKFAITFIAALSLQLLYIIFICKAGYLSIDEFTYHFISKSFHDSWSLFIENGYVEFPSPWLQTYSGVSTMHIGAVNGRLVPQYPFGAAVFLDPFYRIFGYSGLYVANTLAFYGIILLIVYIANSLGFKKKESCMACFLFTFCTYSLDYAVAAWPHMIGAFFVLLSFALSLAYIKSENNLFFLLSAFICGIGCTIRYDVIMCLPGIFAICIFYKKLRLSTLLSGISGLLPALTLLSVTNYYKFNSWLPFTYGESVSDIWNKFGSAVTIILASVVLLVVCSIISKSIFNNKNKVYNYYAFLPVVSAFILYLIFNHLQFFYNILVSFNSASVSVPYADRGMLGGILMFGAFKKALLQSCPYFSLILLLFIPSFFKRHSQLYTVLLPVPLTYIFFFSYYNWHGGLALNMRYLLPAAPFLVLIFIKAISAYAPFDRKQIIYAIFAGTAVFITFILGIKELILHEIIVLYVPIFLSVCILFFGISDLFLRKCRFALKFFMTFAIVHSFWISVSYDLAVATIYRSRTYEQGKWVAERVRPNTVILSYAFETFYNLLEIPGVVLHKHNLRSEPFGDKGEMVKKYLNSKKSFYLAGLIQNETIMENWLTKSGFILLKKETYKKEFLLTHFTKS